MGDRSGGSFQPEFSSQAQPLPDVRRGLAVGCHAPAEHDELGRVKVALAPVRPQGADLELKNFRVDVVDGRLVPTKTTIIKSPEKE
jgi:hypothetical protein